MADTKKVLDPKDFVTRAITRLRTDKSKGIHVVISGFNKAWRDHYGTDPRKGLEALVEKGHFATRPVKFGAMLYFPQDAPAMSPSVGAKALETITAN